MILGLGIDIVNVDRLKKSYENFGERFLKKIFTDKEIDYCERFQKKFESYAGKFSVKEAFMKAIGKGIKQGVWFNNIEVLNYETQQPYVNLYGNAKLFFEEINGSNIFVSITHTSNVGAAVVIIEK